MFQGVKGRGGGLAIGCQPPIQARQVGKLPIKIEQSNSKISERLVSYVDSLIQMNKQIKLSLISIDRERMQRQIEAADRQIDRLVYELYGLSEDEIRVVEGG